MTDHEIYQFMTLCFDITRINNDIKSGNLRPKLISLDPEFIDEFAQQVQCLKRGIPAIDQRVGIFSSINAPYAMTLSPERLAEPLVIVHTPNGKGMLNLYGTGNNYLLADGQHRLARAFMDGRKTPLNAYQLNKSQSRKYMLGTS